MDRTSHLRPSRRSTATLVAAGVALATLLSTSPADAAPTSPGTPSATVAPTSTPAASTPATSTATSTTSPTTPAPETPTTPAPPTTTPPPSTPAPSTPAPSTPAPSTPAPSTPAPSTPAPSTPAPSTPVPSAPSSPAPTTAPTGTPAPRTPAVRAQDGDGAQSRPDVPQSTPAETAARAEQARRLAAAIADQQAGLDAARLAVDDLGRRYDEAMTAKEEALARQAAATAERQVQEQRLEGARALLRLKQTDLGRWASQTYRNGPRSRSVESWLELLEADRTDDIAQRVEMVEHVGRWRGSVVDTVAEAEAVQADATEQAATAASAATAAAWQATMAAGKASRLLDEQRLHIALITELLAGLQGTATEASAAARAAAQQRLGLVGAVGACVGSDISAYPNGGVPVQALCPLWAAPGHHLRADAAHAFQSLSEAYAVQFGDPVCVTDSYRTLEEQVAVFAAKPNLAARPGTSNHGWGRALDLCGGIQSFGTAQHVWMQANAPRFGFVHPQWAQAGGSKPEAWHWEFAA